MCHSRRADFEPRTYDDRANRHRQESCRDIAPAVSALAPALEREIRTMDGLMSEKSHCLCDETFVIDELQSRECLIVDTDWQSQHAKLAGINRSPVQSPD